MNPSPELARVLAPLEGVTRSGTGYSACCPAHDDRTASLSLADGREGVVVKCHAGCTPDAILGALGLSYADLYPAKETTPAALPAPPSRAATYAYEDEAGHPLFRVVRFAYPDGRKTFRQERWEPGTGGGTYRPGMTADGGGKVRRVLYRLPTVRAACEAGRVVFVAEGEKDVHALESLGFTATTNPGGAGKWQDEYAAALRGAARVVVLPDNDAPGRKHAAIVARACLAHGVSVCVVELPGLPRKGDVSNWLETMGGDVDAAAASLRRMATDTPLCTAEDLDAITARDVPEGPGRDAEKLSAQTSPYGEQKANARRTRAEKPDPAALLAAFRTAAELADDPPKQTEWYVPGFLPRGAFVQLTGAAKGGGKTTFLLYALAAVLTAREFLGEPTMRCPVVYLTEQSRETFENEYLSKAGLVGCEDLHVLYGYLTTAYAWEDVMRVAVEKAREVGAGIICVDTFAYFVRVSDEQDAAIMGAAVRPLQDAAATGLSVVAVHHDRKGGGETWDSGRGSSAFAGAVDVLVNLRRAQGGGRETLRELRAEGRYGGLHSSLMIELTEEGYEACGTSQDVTHREATRVLAGLLPLSVADAMTIPEMVEEVKAKMPASRATVQRALDTLTKERRAAVTGEGKKGDPYRYYLHGLEDADAPAQTRHEPAPGPEMLSAHYGEGAEQKRNGAMPEPPAVPPSDTPEMLSAQTPVALSRKHLNGTGDATGDGAAHRIHEHFRQHEAEGNYEDL